MYCKSYDVWQLIEENHDCETLDPYRMYYSSDADFTHGELIKVPYDFDLAKYLSK